MAEEAEKHVIEEEIDEDEVLTGPFRPMGETTGILIVPDLDLSQVEGIDYDVVRNDEYEKGEILKVYFKLNSGSTGYRLYRIPEDHRSFAADEMKNFSVLPPSAIEEGE